MDALVTDTHLRSSTAGVRALGRAGLQVLAASPLRHAAGRWSRMTAARALTPDARTDPERFAERVAQLADRHGPLIAYPGREESLEVLLEAWERLPADVLPYPGPEPVQRLRDKQGLAELAARAGLRGPRVLTTGDGPGLLADSPPTPCIVKPARPGLTLASARHAETALELSAVLEGLPPDEPLLAQEVVGGPLIILGIVLNREGDVSAGFQHVATRTWPRTAGAGAVGVSVPLDHGIVEKARELLRATGYWGLAQFDLLAGAGEPALIDVNPRFYDSLPLALACGVNLPATWHDVARGVPTPPQVAYPSGVRYRWLEADLHAALTGSPAVLWSGARPRVGAMWAADDVPGSVLLAVDTVVAWMGRRLSGVEHGLRPSAREGPSN